jgi:hypothetical protein
MTTGLMAKAAEPGQLMRNIQPMTSQAAPPTKGDQP